MKVRNNKMRNANKWNEIKTGKQTVEIEGNQNGKQQPAFLWTRPYIMRVDKMWRKVATFFFFWKTEIRGKTSKGKGTIANPDSRGIKNIRSRLKHCKTPAQHWSLIWIPMPQMWSHMLFDNDLPFYPVVFSGKSYSSLCGLAQSNTNYRSSDNHTF